MNNKKMALIHALTLTLLFYMDVITYPCPNPDADVGKMAQITSQYVDILFPQFCCYET